MASTPQRGTLGPFLLTVAGLTHPDGTEGVLGPRRDQTLLCGVFLLQVGPARGRLRAVRGSAMPMTTEQLQEHLAQAEWHIAELKWRIAKQELSVAVIPPESLAREDAIRALELLKDSLPILEKHRELILTWIEEKAK